MGSGRNPAEKCCLVQKTQFFLLPFPGNCIYADEARELQYDERIRNTWLEMRKGIGSCDKPLVRAPQEDYHVVVLSPRAAEIKPKTEVNHD